MLKRRLLKAIFGVGIYSEPHWSQCQDRILNFGIWDPIDQEWLETGLICYFKKL